MPKKPTSRKTSNVKKAQHTITVHKADKSVAMKSVPWLFVAALGVMTVSMEVVYWPGELFVSYLPQVMILLAGFGMAYLALFTWAVIKEGLAAYMSKLGRHVYFAFIIIVLLGVYVLVRSTHLVEPAAFVDQLREPEKSLTVGTFNKLYVNTSFSKGSDFLVAEKVDVITLQEIEFDEVVEISRKLGYGNYFITECGCSAGESDVAVVSRYPITNAQTIYEHRNAVILRAVINSEAHGQFVVFVLHIHVPFGPSEVSLRGEMYDILTQAVLDEQYPVFVMGDFNTTVYSPQMTDFVNSVDGVVGNVVKRRWPQCSWSVTRLGGAACLRIDHVFVPSGATVKDLKIGEQSDSDHQPIVVELSF